jgi:hypothetical protein
MTTQQQRPRILLRLAFVLGPILLGAVMWLAEQLPPATEEEPVEVAEQAVSPAPGQPVAQAPAAQPPSEQAATAQAPAEQAPVAAARNDPWPAAAPTPAEPLAPAPASTPTPAVDPEPSVSDRFADATPPSELPPPVAWYAPVAAVPTEARLASLTQPAIVVLPPAATSADRSRLVVRTLTPAVAAAIFPPPLRPAPPPLNLRASVSDAAPARDTAAAEMIAPPPGTPPALTAIDPNRLQTLMQQGASGFTGADDLQQAKGLRLVRIAAALGYAPARSLIAREFPQSRVLRLVIPAADAVRYSLDAFTGDPAAADTPDAAFAPLADYFAERQAHSLYAGHLIEAIQDDRRLQADDRLQGIFDVLRQIPGACAEMVRLVALPPTWSGPGCPPALRFYLQSNARTRATLGRDANSRRLALSQLQALAAAR